MIVCRATSMLAAYLFCVLIFPCEAISSVVQFNFTGTITAAFDNDTSTSPDNVFGAEVATGDSISGFFTIDTNAAVTQTVSGFNGQGTGASYEQFTPLKISATMDGVTFESDGTFLSSVINDFVTNAGAAPIDIFGVGDGVETGLQNLTGDTILVDGNVETGRISLQFNDSTATALGSDMLPSLLDRSAFDFAEGRINGTNAQGIFGFATYSIDTITAVPEPSSAILVLLTGLAGMAKRRR